MFKHGFMDNPRYVYDVFLSHWSRVNFARKHTGCQALELGCGDSLASCQIAAAHNVKKCYLVDVGKFATMEMDFYKTLSNSLRRDGVQVRDVENCASVTEMLIALNAEYLTEGLRSLKAIPSGSVDFIWSQAVLEHIRRSEFLDTMKELRRILHPEGAMSHRVDLRDHLQEALNNLRFPHKAWESSLMSNSGFYTNRIRYSQMLEMMQLAGFQTQVTGVDRWNKLPTPRKKLAEEFRSVPEDDLLVSGFDVILKPF